MAYTTINDPSAYFHTQIYTGTGANQDIVNDANSGNFKPDLLWVKNRGNASYDMQHFDSTRGLNKVLHLGSQYATAAEETGGTSGVQTFNTNGFRGGSSSNIYNVLWVNGLNNTYVAWQWKINGGTTATNTTGSVDSVVQANTDAGLSVVTFTTASSGNFSVGHGLGVQPAMIITKSREGTSQWYAWHKSLTGGNSNTSYLVSFNRTDEEASYNNAWGAGVTSSVFGMQSGNTASASKDYVAYCFAEKQGYSKFGSYIGNGNANGPFVHIGFKPALVVVKRSIAPGSVQYGNWFMYDNKRGPSNLNDNTIEANDKAAEVTGSVGLDFLSNGFKVRDTGNDNNVSGNTYIYMAFAENPFVTSTGIPATAG